MMSEVRGSQRRQGRTYEYVCGEGRTAKKNELKKMRLGLVVWSHFLLARTLELASNRRDPICRSLPDSVLV